MPVLRIPLALFGLLCLSVSTRAQGAGLEGTWKAPSVNAARPAGEWQTFDIHLAGNKVTVIHNEKKVIDDFELKGPTGGALNIKHGEPGPIRLQGDHGDVEYRNIRIREFRRLD